MSNQLSAFLSDPEARLAIKAASLRQSFGRFVKEAWTHCTGYEYLHGPHCEVIVRHREGVASGKITRLLINVPPSTYKTVIGGAMFPAWCWARGQAEDFIFYGYNVQLATDASVMCRGLLASQWFRDLFPNVQVSSDDDSKSYFRLESGGSRRVSPIGGGATGYHPSIIEVDDPLSRDEADSAAERERVKAWYFQTMSTRGVGKGARHIVQQQRLHVDDLSGHIARHSEHLLTAYGDSPWHHVRLPMRYDPAIAMEDRGFGGDWRTVPGELLYPALLDEPKVISIERSLGPIASRSQLQQDPRRSETSLFRVEKLKVIGRTELPRRFKKLVRAWDLASLENSGDFTVGILMGSYCPEGASWDHFVILDVQRKQTRDPIGLILSANMMDQFWGKVSVAIEMQPAAAGVLLDRQIRERLSDCCEIISVRPAGSKEFRFGPLAGAMGYGDISILGGPYVPEFISELDEYPGRYDDQADGAAMAYKSLVESVGNVACCAADRSTKPRDSERCKNELCNRPSFEATGYCCDNCQRGEKCSPICCNRWTDWFNRHSPTEYEPRGIRRSSFLRDKFR